MLVLAVFLLPLIPAYGVGGPYIPTPFHGLTIGIYAGQCGRQVLASLFYLVTGIGPYIELDTPCNETYPPV